MLGSQGQDYLLSVNARNVRYPVLHLQLQGPTFSDVCGLPFEKNVLILVHSKFHGNRELFFHSKKSCIKNDRSMNRKPTKNFLCVC